MFIIDWWNNLGMASQIFACMAIPATIVLIVQTILMIIGIGGDDADISDGVADDVSDVGDGVFGEDSVGDIDDAAGFDGLRIFTLRGIIAFFVVFGWLGIAMDAAGAPIYATLPVAFAGGVAIMFVLSFIFRAVMKLRSDGNADNKNAVGTCGKVYLTIPPSRSGEGKVNVMLQGSYVERSAVTDETEPIPTGTEIVVVGISGQTELVVKKK